MFVKMEEALSGTAFYKNCLSTWPPPFNIASFDLCLLLIILWSFFYPIVRDVIADRISRKREQRWLAEYRRRERKKIELARDIQEQMEHLWEQAVTDQEHIGSEEDDYYFDEEDVPQEAEAEMPPQNEVYMTEDTDFKTEPAGSEEVTEERRSCEEEALTEMDTSEPPPEDTEAKPDETQSCEAAKEAEDEYSRLMKRIRQNREDKKAAEIIAHKQEENRQRNLTEIDRKLSERIIAQSIKAEKVHEQDVDLERAKKEAANQKQAEAEKRKARERREQIERMKREKRSSRTQNTHDGQTHERSDHRSRRRHG